MDNDVDEADVEPACELIDTGYGLGVLARLQNSSWCDIDIYGNSSGFADDVELLPIKAHKTILASASPHLKDAFLVKGFIESGAKEYTIEQIDHKTLQLIVDFIYQSKLCVSGADVFKCLERVIVAADYLVMPDLVRLCGQALDKPAYLNTASCVSKWLFATKHNCEVLAVAAAGFAATILDDVSAQDEFLNLSVGNVAELVKYLAVVSANADDIGEAVADWIEFHESVRQPLCETVMRHVPFQKMSKCGLRNLKKKSWLSAGLLSKVQQIREIRIELDDVKIREENLKSTLRTILKEYEDVEAAAVRSCYGGTILTGNLTPAQRGEKRKLARLLLDE